MLDKQAKNARHIHLFELIIFPILGVLLFVSKLAFEYIANFHGIGLLLATYTIAFRRKALFPLGVFVFLTGLYAGFNFWWVPYLYIWTILWAFLMLVPTGWKLEHRVFLSWGIIVLHGLCYGCLYAPAWALYAHLSFKATLAWIAAGFSFDVMHAVGNFIMGFLIYPLARVLLKLKAMYM